MKLTSIELRSEDSLLRPSKACVLSFRDPKGDNPYIIMGIDGLAADQIIPHHYSGSGNSSLKYYNLMLQKREVIIKVALNPSFELNKTYSDLRDELYKMISYSRTGLVYIKFKNENETTAITKGFITKLDASSSSNKPEVQITILCDDPMLQAPRKTVVDITGFDPGGTIINDTLSTAPHGFRFGMNFTGLVYNLTISDPTNPYWEFELATWQIGGFKDGDVLHFSSYPKDKYLYVARGGTNIHIADSLTFNSVWPIIFPGENVFVFNPSPYLNWAFIEYTSTYWGI